MKTLEVRRFFVKDVVFDDASLFSNGVLHLNKKDLCELVLEGIDGFKVDMKLAKPTDSTRIVHIMDTVKPACKINDNVFSGWSEKNETAGNGVSHQLEGVAVMQTCEFSGVQEGIVDMSGVGSHYSYFSSIINLVIEMQLIDENMNKQDFEKCAKTIILRAAEYLATLTLNVKEDKTEVFALFQETSNLSKIGYVQYIQAQGPLRNVFLHGESCVNMEPVWIHPNELMDGALVSSNFVVACQKNPTYCLQQNPVITELYERDGKDLQFGGVVISTESNGLDEKKQNAESIAKIARQKGFDGVVISQEGGGHADVDLMMCVDACEKNGVATVVLTNEIAGINGEMAPLTSFSERANAIVTVGNNDEVIKLSAMELAIGGQAILGGKYKATQALETSLGILYTATNQLGCNKMTTATY